MDYKLIRSKRKTLAIHIINGEVVVKAPLVATEEYIERFLSSKSAWIARKLKDSARKSEMTKGLFDATTAMYHGAEVPIIVTDAVKRVKLCDDAVYVPQKFDDAKSVLRAIGNAYRRIAEKELKDLLDGMSALTGLKYNGFALTNARTQWGSCDGSCNIRLNFRLIMLDRELAEYVVIHELSHTLHHDHSKLFWAEVKRLMPQYAAAKKRLKTYSVLTSLYR